MYHVPIYFSWLKPYLYEIYMFSVKLVQMCDL